MSQQVPYRYELFPIISKLRKILADNLVQSCTTGSPLLIIIRCRVGYKVKMSNLYVFLVISIRSTAILLALTNKHEYDRSASHYYESAH